MEISQFYSNIFHFGMNAESFKGKIIGNYKIKGTIGQGAFSIVCLAEEIELKSKDPNFDNNPEFVLYKLHEEFTTFSSSTDKDFRIECSNNYSLMRKTFTQVSDNSVVDELRKSSDKNLEILQKYLTDGNYWTKNQIRNMIDGNARFLKKEYFNIIKAIADPKLFPLVYQDNKDILDAQIKELIDEFVLYVA